MIGNSPPFIYNDLSIFERLWWLWLIILLVIIILICCCILILFLLFKRKTNRDKRQRIINEIEKIRKKRDSIKDFGNINDNEDNRKIDNFNTMTTAPNVSPSHTAELIRNGRGTPFSGKKVIINDNSGMTTIPSGSDNRIRQPENHIINRQKMYSKERSYNISDNRGEIIEEGIDHAKFGFNATNV